MARAPKARKGGVGVIAFRLGDAAVSVVRDEVLRFYEYVAALLTDERASKLSVGTTIPVPQAAVKDAATLFSLASEGLNGPAREAAYLIVDLANPPREDLPLFTFIQSLIGALAADWWKTSQDRPVVVLLPAVLSKKDLIHGLVQPHLTQGHLAMIDSGGELFGTIRSSKSFKAADYRSALREAQEDPLVLLERKLIRRIGHFRRYDAGQVATKFFYDGRLCTSEIIRILEQRYSRAHPDQILVHAPHSRWLAEAASAFGLDHGIEVVDLEPIMSKKGHATPAIKKYVLLLVPMVDTGTTMEAIYTLLSDLNNDATVQTLSIMSTSGTNNKRTLGSPSKKFSIDYLVDVKQVHFDDTSQPPCTKDHAGSNYDLDAEPMELTSYAFWAMVGETGLTEEQDVPKELRPSVGMVPRFPAIMVSNGPLLAYKIDQLLRGVKEGLPVDPVLVCPLETGAIALSDCVRSMFKYGVVRIPRSVLRRAELNGSVAEASTFLTSKHAGDDWYQQLVSASKGASTRAILLDEFTVSGGTFGRLETLCNALNLPVEQHLCLVDFSVNIPDGARRGVLSLYRLPLEASL